MFCKKRNSFATFVISSIRSGPLQAGRQRAWSMPGWRWPFEGQRALQAARAAEAAAGHAGSQGSSSGARCGSLVVQPELLRQRVDVPAGDEELQAVETLHAGYVRVPPHQHVPAGTATCTPRSYPPWNKYSLACPQTPDLCNSLSSHPKHRRIAAAPTEVLRVPASVSRPAIQPTASSLTRDSVASSVRLGKPTACRQAGRYGWGPGGN